MVEWLKNICFDPFKYGLDKANIIAVKTISVIFNIFGKRLLKMDTDKIIMKNECNDDRDIFYLYPLHLKQIEQDVGLNILRIEEGIINNLIISIPWKAILSEPTEINISNINLIISFSQNTNNISLNLLENTNSYFSNKNIIKENQDLLNAYNEINTLLTEYFNKINLKINQIEIDFTNHFKIIIYNSIINNELVDIENIYIYPFNNINNKIVSINKIKFDIKKNSLYISKIVIDSNIITYIPEFYMNDSKDKFNMNIMIDNFKMDQISAKKIDFNINQNNLTLRKISCLKIDNILIFKEDSYDNNNLFIFEFNSNILLFTKCINIKLGNINKLLDWINKIQYIISYTMNKFIIFGLDDKITNSKSLCINNIFANIVYGDDIFNIFIDNIYIDEKIKLGNIKINYNDKNSIIENIYFDNSNAIILEEIIVTCEEFKAKSYLTKIIKQTSKLDVYFDTANINNIIQIINFVTNIIEKFTLKYDKSHIDQSIIKKYNNIDLSTNVSGLSKSLMAMNINTEDNDSSEPMIINLYIKNTNILFKYNNIDYDVFLKNGHICITNKYACNINAEILMNGYLIAKLNAEHITNNSFLINSFRIFIDPEIFDQINYLFGTLTPEISEDIEEEIEITSEGLKQLQEALARSIISKSIVDMEQTINQNINIILQKNKQKNISENTINILDTPNVKILLDSFVNLRNAIIDNYNIEHNEDKDINIKLFIKSLHIYFFNKLVKFNSNIKNNNAFLCAVFKDIIFSKKLEPLPEQKHKPLIRIIENSKVSKIKVRERYLIKMKTGAILDIACNDPEWKYFIKFSNHNMFNADISLYGSTMRANIIVSPFTTNIREETLFKLLAFFSNSHHPPKSSEPIYIEYFNINAIDVSVNYYPLILKQIGTVSNSLTLKDFKIRLSSQTILNIDRIDKLLNIILSQWKADINPNNILQFVPNIKLIHPYTVPIIQFIQLTTKYFKHSKNKKKIRTITQNIGHGVDIINTLVNYGINQVWELFN